MADATWGRRLGGKREKEEEEEEEEEEEVVVGLKSLRAKNWLLGAGSDGRPWPMLPAVTRQHELHSSALPRRHLCWSYRV